MTESAPFNAWSTMGLSGTVFPRRYVASVQITTCHDRDTREGSTTGKVSVSRGKDISNKLVSKPWPANHQSVSAERLTWWTAPEKWGGEIAIH